MISMIVIVQSTGACLCMIYLMDMISMIVLVQYTGACSYMISHMNLVVHALLSCCSFHAGASQVLSVRQALLRACLHVAHDLQDQTQVHCSTRQQSGGGRGSPWVPVRHICIASAGTSCGEKGRSLREMLSRLSQVQVLNMSLWNQGGDPWTCAGS